MTVPDCIRVLICRVGVFVCLAQNSYARAKALLRQKEALLHDIANALMLHETLTGADIQQYAPVAIDDLTPCALHTCVRPRSM